MSENKPEELNSQAVPFFARFLEGQSFEELSDKQSETISGGSCGVTNKHKGELRETRKYPSDQEDVVTEKYPSDSDEVTTLKYPSDGEEHGGAIQ
ncbi:microviridin/marinostatin family tricyclic proteinase inhibitor [uncultured Nostoc sp.]|uniref:microviridin/marinostatin family tricyclic proteinase inhibitor n=1 Tax=uncultured Nostoc sp. TaxID=340711 RepID=UPI0035CA820E